MAVRVIDWKSERDHLGRIASASYICPNCGNRSWLGLHEIRESGAVFPAVECDHDCGFKDEHIVFAGWPHGFIPRGGPG